MPHTEARCGAAQRPCRALAPVSTCFTDLAAFTGGTANLSDNDHAPERVNGSLVSAITCRLLRQPVLLGPDFLPAESERGADRVVILGYEVWQNRYGDDPDVIGRMLRVNEEPSTIVGVMPKGMQCPSNADTWRPLQPTDDLDQRDRRCISSTSGSTAIGCSRRGCSS